MALLPARCCCVALAATHTPAAPSSPWTAHTHRRLSFRAHVGQPQPQGDRLQEAPRSLWAPDHQGETAALPSARTVAALLYHFLPPAARPTRHGQPAHTHTHSDTSALAPTQKNPMLTKTGFDALKSVRGELEVRPLRCASRTVAASLAATQGAPIAPPPRWQSPCVQPYAALPLSRPPAGG